MTTLLRDLIDIPRTAGADDYVLKLTDGVSRTHAEATVAEYVVTDELAGAFDQALDLVAAALRDGSSRAAFLSGSFGSGKSHFMAVLYALLGHEPFARSKPEFASVIASHDAALSGKKILRLAYHFLGADTMEEVVLGGYVTQIRALHPNCELPAVQNSDSFLEDIEGRRVDMGSLAFFAKLNARTAADAGDVWGAVLGSDWDAETYAAARAAEQGDPARNRLVHDLVTAYSSASYTRLADYVPLDQGLAAIATHAKSLGYDAVVLFLDELVLWLAFQVRNHEFFGREAQKITKLVESGTGDRAVPLVSIVARQMDLRRYFVESGGGMGSEQEALDQAFAHQQGRFATITLGDDNLPFVAEKRLLKPLDDRAKATIDRAFDDLDRRSDVWDVLLDGVNTDAAHRGSDQAAFRRTYPFSPALVSTLRTLASAMQRDRTALKVMQKLLVRGRDSLTVDDVIPVGDIFDDVVEGNNAVSVEMAGRITNARKLYREKVRPVLLRTHNLADSDVAALPANHAFHADDRLAKTLILSAVAPDVPALKALTPGRLAALNHGSIRSPLAGEEGSVALAKIKRWTVEVPEIEISGDSRNPTIHMQISEVEYESVVKRASGEDNAGRRRETLKRLVWEAFGLEAIDDDAFGVQRQARVWRGSRREIEVVFGNIRDRGWLPDPIFEAGVDTWRFVVDYPFDEDGRGASDDFARLDELRAGELNTRTIAWTPRFLTRSVLDDLGRLVVLDWLLGGSGDRWTQHSSHLAESDRIQAHAILQSQQRALRERLSRAVQECYGAATASAAMVEFDPAHERVLTSLDRGFDPAAPVGHDLAAAFANLIDQAFSSTFPAHPEFQPGDREIRPAEISAALAAIERAHQDPDGRVHIEQNRREVIARVINPLQVGYMGETHLLFASDRFPWAMQFSRNMGRDGLEPQDPVTVDRVRGWIRSSPTAYGLRPEIADLVVCAWAVLENRAWYRHGSLVPAPTPGAIPGDIELRPEKLPSAEDWSLAVKRAGALFGFSGNQHRTGAAVAELVEAVAARAAGLSSPAATLVEALTERARQLSAGDGGTGRLATAAAARELVNSLRATSDRVAFVERLAHADLPATDPAAAKSLESAGQVSTAIGAFAWDRLSALLTAERGTDERGQAAKAILDRLRAAFAHDELAQSLIAALRKTDDDIYAWALAGAAPAPAPAPAPSSVPQPTPATRRIVSSSLELDAALTDLRAFAAEHDNEPITVEWRLER